MDFEHGRRPRAAAWAWVALSATQALTALLLLACDDREQREGDRGAEPARSSAPREEGAPISTDGSEALFAGAGALPDLRAVIGMSEEDAIAAFAAHGISVQVRDSHSSPARSLDAELPAIPTSVHMRVTPPPRHVFFMTFDARYQTDQEAALLRGRIERDYGAAVRDETLESLETADGARARQRRTIHRGPPCAEVTQAYEARAFVIRLGSMPVQYTDDGRALERRSPCDALP